MYHYYCSMRVLTRTNGIDSDIGNRLTLAMSQVPGYTVAI
jgi:hypothetical protein